jgi:hypothetical protein
MEFASDGRLFVTEDAVDEVGEGVGQGGRGRGLAETVAPEGFQVFSEAWD